MKTIAAEFLVCIALFVLGLAIACSLFGCATKPNPGFEMPPAEPGVEPGYSTF